MVRVLRKPFVIDGTLSVSVASNYISYRPIRRVCRRAPLIRVKRDY